MNVNGINPEDIRALQANKLQDNQKVDAANEDTEALWQSDVLEADEALFENVNEEDALAMFGLNEEEAAEEVEDPEAVVDDAPEAEEPAEEEDFSHKADDERRILQMRPKAIEVISIDGKNYEVTNVSTTVNNLFYYVEDGKLVIEGSDLKVTAMNNEDKVDDVRILGNRNTVDMGEGDDIIDIEGSMNAIYGGDGNDFIKMRGDYNTADMGKADDTAWIDGIGNQVFGHGGDDNFFAIGDGNVLYGKDGYDSKYYDTSRGDGQEFRIEDTIGPDDPRVKEFDDWVNRVDPSGPPYHNLPKALDGHEVRAYDDDTYTDKYEETPFYYTEYRDIAYRELHVKTTENKETREGLVEFSEIGADGFASIRITPNAYITTDAEGNTTEHDADSVKLVDEKGNEVANPGTLAEILERLATRRLFLMFVEPEPEPENEEE